MTWTALAAAVVGTWLLLQVRAAPDVHVPMPVALLGCLVIAAPLAVAWRWPLAATAALWSAAALFSAFVTPLGTKFAAISLAFVPPFMVAYFGGPPPRGRRTGDLLPGRPVVLRLDGFCQELRIRHHARRLDRRPRPDVRVRPGRGAAGQQPAARRAGRGQPASAPSRRNGPGSRVTCTTRSVIT